MTCRRTREDRTQIHIRGRHTDPLPKDHPDRCPGCEPCPRPAKHHCGICTRHLDEAETQTCTDCRAEARRDLHALLELAALLPDHALHAAHDAHLVAADPIPGGDALVMMSRGSEGLDDDEARDDEPHPPSYLLAWWEEEWREQLGLDSRPLMFRHRPAHVLVRAHAFLDQYLTWASANHAGFHAFARDLKAARRHLEELLRAGDQPMTGVSCFQCGATLERDYRRPKPCDCGPRPRTLHIGSHARTDVCCLGCAAQLRWELNHQGHDQGGLKDTDGYAGWHCPNCKRRYSRGEYQLAVRARHDEVAPALPASELAERLGVAPATIWSWAQRGFVRRRGRSEDRRTLYDVADALKHASKRHGDTAVNR